MSCTPISGGCERLLTEVFVAYLNARDGSLYEHRACLDQLDKTRPQPECLYAEAEDARLLVIERKSILWPETYAYEHSKDHDLVNEITAGLQGIEFDGPYVLWMPSLANFVRSDLPILGQTVAEAIRKCYGGLCSGQAVKIECRGVTFKLCFQQFYERDEDWPEHGLGFSWPLVNALIETGDLQQQICGQLRKIFNSCDRKFSGYGHARRVLMLDPYGEVRFRDARWWGEALAGNPPPASVEEIWIGTEEIVPFGEDEWIFEQVFGPGIEF